MIFTIVASVAIGFALVGLAWSLPFVTFGHALLLGVLITGLLVYLGATDRQ